MIHFLKLIRWKNVLLIILIQYLIKYVLSSAFNVDTALNDFDFLLLVIATVSIAAAGNIINDIYDIKIDRINKPHKVIIDTHISKRIGYVYYMLLTLLGIGLGFYLSNLVERPIFFIVFIITSALLYFYSRYLKTFFLIGNLVISALVAMSIILVGMFDLFPMMTHENQQARSALFKIILNYAIFAFVVNLMREIIKDIQDVDGDYQAGMQTLPIVLGRSRALNVVFVISIILLFAIVFYLISNLYQRPIAIIYFIVCIIAPLLYFTTKVLNSETQKEIQKLSNLLKLIMLTGILSILLYLF